MSKVSVSFNFGCEDYEGKAHSNATNSVGGIGVSFIVVISGNNKQIKYVDLEFGALNNVGELIPDTATGEVTFTIQSVGPFKPNKKGEARVGYHDYKEIVYYNKSIKQLALVNVKITFMDGTEENIAGKNCERRKGCYVATCVYGSYDCPPVWTLRRYRDYKLAKTWYGRVFIYTYYAISPTLVRWFGETKWFKNMWKPKLDKMVKKLQAEGFESTPYDDKIWR